MFKEYTTPHLQIRLTGATQDMVDAQFFVALLGRRGEIRKEAVLEDNLLNIDLTQDDTAALGAGQVFIEVTCIQGGRVIKSNTIRAECEGAILKEIYNNQDLTPETETETETKDTTESELGG